MRVVASHCHTQKERTNERMHSPSRVLDTIAYVPAGREPRDHVFPVKAVRRTHVNGTWQCGGTVCVGKWQLLASLPHFHTWEGVLKGVSFSL